MSFREYLNEVRRGRGRKTPPGPKTQHRRRQIAYEEVHNFILDNAEDPKSKEVKDDLAAIEDAVNVNSMASNTYGTDKFEKYSRDSKGINIKARRVMDKYNFPISDFNKLLK